MTYIVVTCVSVWGNIVDMLFAMRVMHTLLLFVDSYQSIPACACSAHVMTRCLHVSACTLDGRAGIRTLTRHASAQERQR